MQENKFSNNTEYDQFGKLVSGMLEDHCTPVDADCWKEIEKEIRRPRRKKIIWWYMGSAAVIIGVLMLFIDPLSDNPDINNATAEIPKAMAIIEESDISQENKYNNEKIIERIEVEKDSKQIQQKNIQQLSSTKILTSEKLQHLADSLNVDSTESQQVLVVELEKKEMSTNKKESTKSRGSNLTDKVFLLEEPLLIAKAESKKEWTFGLGMGTGGGISLRDRYADYQMSNDFNTSNPGEIINTNPENILENKEWDFNYNLPISFGFMIKRDFSNIVGIESGLVYTYLSTDMKRHTNASMSARLSQKGTLQLHYLGVPANVVVNMWKNPQWDIYASAGVMFEKGIRSHQKITSYKNSEETRVDQKNNNWIRGSQWSLNGAVGVSYTITHSWRLYVEPRVSYYFNNNQPMSIRTDKSTIFNLNAGVKFNLK